MRSLMSTTRAVGFEELYNGFVDYVCGTDVLCDVTHHILSCGMNCIEYGFLVFLHSRVVMLARQSCGLGYGRRP